MREDCVAYLEKKTNFDFMPNTPHQEDVDDEAEEEEEVLVRIK